MISREHVAKVVVGFGKIGLFAERVTESGFRLLRIVLPDAHQAEKVLCLWLFGSISRCSPQCLLRLRKHPLAQIGTSQIGEKCLVGRRRSNRLSQHVRSPQSSFRPSAAANCRVAGPNPEFLRSASLYQ